MKRITLFMIATATLLHAQIIMPGDYVEFPLRPPSAKAQGRTCA
jgi:hypothetical protein